MRVLSFKDNVTILCVSNGIDAKEYCSIIISYFEEWSVVYHYNWVKLLIMNDVVIGPHLKPEYNNKAS